MTFRIDQAFIEQANGAEASALEEDLEALTRNLRRRGIALAPVLAALKQFQVALPSWGVGTGGTRFARFPMAGEPRGIYEKLDDCATVQQLVRATPNISLHFPWDKVDDSAALKTYAQALGLGFDAVNSNTFQDQAGATQSYRFGSLTHTDAAVRDHAIAHNIECIKRGAALGSKALTVWIGDGSNFAGQSNLTTSFERYLESMTAIYAALPADWQIFIEHKLYEPAFYATVIADWGTSYAAAAALGPKAKCLVDLGHHAPTVNIEQIVARLVHLRKLAGFHFNDSRYGDDDLDSGSVDPFRLFLVFNELVDATARGAAEFALAYMIDQSHNVTDPIESLLSSAVSIQRAYAQALLVDRAALAEAQARNDALGAHNILKAAFNTDVSPLLAEVRRLSGGAIAPLKTYRASQYRHYKASERPAAAVAAAGIV